uniref:PsbB mRNA maturation factor Mbb1, chloroplastic n=1 Tax=Timspurckia oligopyrenoides TaxID=708627 RepID=A0A7S1ETH5_9RHOD|mmetsp:Transcript_7456/g.13481  ORF Transcript_7456/g.13481 Transcript_7456/m.13481 type:complete len:543 (+) Transcript_7456:42-1670(+)
MVAFIQVFGGLFGTNSLDKVGVKSRVSSCSRVSNVRMSAAQSSNSYSSRKWKKVKSDRRSIDTVETHGVVSESEVLSQDPEDQMRAVMSRTLDGKVWMSMVKDALKRRDDLLANKILREAVTRLPEDASLLYMLGETERRAKRYEVARSYYQKCVETDSDYSMAYLSWSSMEYQLKRVETARVILQQGIQNAEKRCARLSHALAVLEVHENRPSAAREVLQNALRNQPGNAYLNQALAVLEYSEGNVQRARELLQIATTANPSHVLSWLTRAFVEEKEGSISLARLYMASGASKRGKGALMLWREWLALETRLGHYNKAMEICERACRRFPRELEFYESWAKVLSQDPNASTEAVYSVVKRGLAVDSSYAPLWAMLGSLEQQNGSFEKARQAYAAGARHAASDESRKKLIYSWAMLEMSEGNGERAQKLFGLADSGFNKATEEWAELSSSSSSEESTETSDFKQEKRVQKRTSSGAQHNRKWTQNAAARNGWSRSPLNNSSFFVNEILSGIVHPIRMLNSLSTSHNVVYSPSDSFRSNSLEA